MSEQSSVNYIKYRTFFQMPENIALDIPMKQIEQEVQVIEPSDRKGELSYMLAEAYYNGTNNTTRNVKEAVRWYKEAEKLGDGYAMW